MPISVMGLVAGLVIARSKNLPGPQVAEDALLAGVIRPPIAGIVLATALANNQASSAPATAPSGPTIAALYPGYGQVGSTVTITGTNFQPVDNVSVTFGGVTADLDVNGSTTITVTVPGDPPAVATNVPVVVSVGSVASAPQQFMIVPGE